MVGWDGWFPGRVRGREHDYGANEAQVLCTLLTNKNEAFGPINLMFTKPVD